MQSPWLCSNTPLVRDQVSTLSCILLLTTLIMMAHLADAHTQCFSNAHAHFPVACAELTWQKGLFGAGFKAFIG